MYDFLKKKKNELKVLDSDYISAPLLRAKQYIEDMYGAY